VGNPNINDNTVDTTPTSKLLKIGLKKSYLENTSKYGCNVGLNINILSTLSKSTMLLKDARTIHINGKVAQISIITKSK
jgi:hypothetical protein